MEHTWRWFGPADPITLEEVRQTGATGVVTALHEVPNGEVWPVDAIQERMDLIDAAGLSWSVVESVPVHEDIKRGGGLRDRWIENYGATLRNLAACGIDVVCYNFMPVLDWTRTELDHRLPDGAGALRFDADAIAAFDLFILKRPAASEEYDDAATARAREVHEQLGVEGRTRLVETVLAGLPGAEAGYDLAQFRAELATFAQVGPEELRENLGYFLQGVVPVAEEAGVRLAIHPDDPPRPMFGLPRVVSTEADAARLLDAVPSPANGLTFCVGSYGVRADNDVVAMARRFAERIYFVHLRSTRREGSTGSFHEAGHIDGDVDMVAVVQALVEEELRRECDGGPRMPMRPDHGHQILDDRRRSTRPGYPLIGRLKGLAELRGVELAVRRALGGAAG